MALMAGKTVKRKANVLSSSSRKKAKTQQLSANDLPWKTVSTRQEAGIDSEMNGIMELEEVDGVEVVYEQTDNGRVVRFNVAEDRHEALTESRESISDQPEAGPSSPHNISDDVDELVAEEQPFDSDVSVFDVKVEADEDTSTLLADKPEGQQPGKRGKGKGKGKGKDKGNAQLSATQATKSKGPPLVSVAAIVGGMSAQKQRRILDRGVDILVATPGRLWDILQEDDSLATDIKNLRYLVLDEADRMIETGHFAELDNILRLTLKEAPEDEIEPEFGLDKSEEAEEDQAPETASGGEMQTFVFSATLSKDLQRNLKRHAPKGRKNKKIASTLDDLLMRLDFRDPDPEVIDLSPAGGLVSTLKESRVDCLATDKDGYLYYFLLRYPGRSLVFLSSIDEEEEIPEMSIELHMLDKLKARIQVARQIDSTQHKIKKENHEKNWLREAAEAMELELDSDLDLSQDDGDKPSKYQKKKRSAKSAALKAELKQLLAQPLIARGVSTRYITSGSRPIVDDVIAGDYHETMIGLTKTEAGDDVLPAKPRKVKKKEEEFEEWNGFSS
ncbi:hypothetical protein EW026_g1631 [Hermanssonia centrifuga]|uniref:ATP-dependent RNA helicase n=1 Tax=Hermanssonia centrifuga TaxID=98765 RepID=A0A4S4KRK6_9APHY|nr:hypothetical protein EW026_g1631 [Hermanssonia centrifuga]